MAGRGAADGGRGRKPRRRMLWVNILRTLGASKGRFVSIACLVALGSFALVGLQATGPDMRSSLTAYTTSYGFTDLYVMGDLGLDEDDMADLEALDGVAAVEFGYLVDVTIAGSTDSVRVQSVPEELSCYELVSGRLPSAADEIALASSLAGEYELGDTISFEEEEDASGSCALATHTFTVVGFVNSSEILGASTMGSTTVGTGTLTSYAVVAAAAFDVDYYMVARIQFEDTAALDPTSQEYLDLVAAHKEEVEDALSGADGRRYAAVCAEYEDAIADGETEVADAEQELDDAAAELADAAAELADAATELDDAAAELADAEAELAEAAAELAEAKAELETAAAELAEAAAELEASEEELAAAETELAVNQAALADSKAALDEAAAELAATQAELEAAAAQLEAAAAQIAKSQATLDEAAAARAALAAQLAALQQTGAADEATLAQIAQLEAAIAAYDEQIAAGQAALSAAEEELAANQAAYEEGLAAYEDAAAQIAAAEAQIAAAEEELEAGWTSYHAGLAEYQEGLAEYEDGVAEYEAALAEYQDGVATYEDGVAEYEDGLAAYEDGVAEYDEAAAEAAEQIADAEAELADARADLAAVDVPAYSVMNHREFYGSNGYTTYVAIYEMVDSVAAIFPTFFYLVAALVISSTMTRMVDEERACAGTLKALGYTDADVLKKFMAYGAAAALIGAAVGIAAGHLLLPTLIYQAFASYFTLPALTLSFYPLVTAAAAALALAVALVPTAIAAKATAAEKPALLMQPKAPANGSKILLERIRPIWNRLSFTHKVTARNLFRYKVRALMTILGVLGSVGLIFFGFAVTNSIGGISARQFGEILGYDLIVAVDEDATSDELAEVEELLQQDGITGSTLVAYESASVVAGSKNDSQNIYLFCADSSDDLAGYLNIYDNGTGELLELASSGAVISKRLSTLTGVGVGDVLTFEDADGVERSVAITGVCEMYIEHFLFMSTEAYEEVFGAAPQENAYLVGVVDELAEDTGALAAGFIAADAVTGVVQNASSLVLLDTIVVSMNIIMLILIVVSIMLACVIVYNLVTINVAERIRELSTIKVLGFHNDEVTMYIYRETIALTAIAIPLGWLFGWMLQQYLINAVPPDRVMFDPSPGLTPFIVSTAVICIVVAAMGLVVYRKLKGVDMLEALKSVD